MNLTRCFFDARKSRTCPSSSSVMSNGIRHARGTDPPMYIMFEVSTHEILPSYRSSNKIPNDSSVGLDVVQVDDRGDEAPVERDEVLLAVHDARTP